MEKLNEFLRKYLDSPFVAVFGVLTIITTLWGVISIYKDIAALGSSRLGALIVAIVLSLLALFVFASYMIPSVRRQYALPLNAKFILTNVNRTWEIDEAGNGMIRDDKTYFFLSEPNDVDRSDAVMSSQPLTLNDIKYESTDSSAVDLERVNKTMLRIFWRPKNDIKVGMPYTHNVVSRFPYMDEGPPLYKIMTIVGSVRTYNYCVSVKSLIPIQQVVVFKERIFQRFKDADRIADRGRVIKRTMAPLPTITDKNRLTWTVDSLPAGTVHYLILYFDKGGANGTTITSQ